MTRPALLLGLAASVSVGLNCLLIRFAHRLPFSKRATGDRWHSGCIPDSGGIAIFAAVAATYLAGFSAGQIAVALGTAAFWILGTIDDRLKLTARTKFAAQAIVAGIAVASGIAVDITSYQSVNLALSWFWLMGITNAFNLIDNMDGLAAGVVVIVAFFRSGLLYANGFNDDALLCAIIAVSFLGFLLFNFKPAKIMMGDGGSMMAGFALAALTIHSPLPHARSFVAGLFYPALTFAYPIFDTALVSVLRKISGRPISVGGRDHSSHRLASLGLQDSTVVFTLWGFTAVGSICGLLSYRLPASTGIAIALLIVFATMFGLFLGTLPAYPAFSAPAIGRLRALRRWVPSLRAAVTILLDSLVAAIAVITAFAMRFDLTIPPSEYRNVSLSVPVVMVSHALGGILFQTYDWSWDFFGMQEVLPLAGSAAVSALACTGLYLAAGEYSRGVLLLYMALGFGLTVIVRSSLRLFRETLPSPLAGPFRRVAIFRADLEGEALARFLLSSAVLALRPVVFFDDRPLREGVRVCGLPVRNIDEDLEKLQREWKLDAVLLPPRDGQPDARETLGGRFQEIGLELCTLDWNLRRWALPQTMLEHLSPAPRRYPPKFVRKRNRH
jgi:UDP-GlcNAc:undecaprenyl-phosphate GlcNAc-1-phosphate transferase